MSCGMRTSLQLMSCRLWQTTCATRNTSTAPSINYFPCPLQLPVKHCFHFCRYARCTRSVSIGKPSLRTQSLVYSGNPLRCYSIKQIVDLCFIDCSAPGILCSSGSLPSSLLHGARYLWQWVNGQWGPWASTRWGTRHQRGRECCGQAPTRSQGKREACHVLLLSCIHQGILEYSMYPHCFGDTIGHWIYALRLPVHSSDLGILCTLVLYSWCCDAAVRGALVLWCVNYLLQVVTSQS
jgi:hypothetical protein